MEQTNAEANRGAPRMLRRHPQEKQAWQDQASRSPNLCRVTLPGKGRSRHASSLAVKKKRATMMRYRKPH